MDTNISAVLDRIDGDWVIFKTSDHQIIRWPKNKLPSNLVSGDQVIIEIKDQASARLEKEQIAKKLLYEILDESADEARIKEKT